MHEAPELAGQARHTVDAVAAVVVEYFPAPQFVHPALACDVLYVPAAHVVHAVDAPVYPALQRQPATLLTPVIECPELAGHAPQVG